MGTTLLWVLHIWYKLTTYILSIYVIIIYCLIRQHILYDNTIREIGTHTYVTYYISVCVLSKQAENCLFYFIVVTPEPHVETYFCYYTTETNMRNQAR